MKNPTIALLACVALAGSAPAQSPAPIEQHGLPGQMAGTEQWIVMFKNRSFDLSEFRAATYARRPHTEVDAIVKKLVASMKADQAPFEEAVKKLGGRVYDQWWLINGCAIEIPFAKLPAVRKLPNVLRLWPNEKVEPLIKAATSASNHNSDAVNLAGDVGKGIATAIVDTGLDSKSGSTGRPHRTFYEDGDLKKRLRLLANKQAGTFPPDNTHPHGTGVAGIAAGGKWGTSGADNGHAPHADILGYSVSNNSGGGSSFQVIAKAWQMVATDAAKFKIRTANNSYSGSPDPLNPSQQALDSAAFNADVCIVVAAGNSASSTRSSQACVNGITVGAVNRNVHTMATFSSRGPLSGSGGRFYPDITGNGVSTVMPRVDNDNGNYIGSGTSMASPQVCGAATLIRAANTSLKADETKAILLASALDISQKNKNPPYNTRNAYGHGLLRDDAAMALTKDKANHGRATVTKATPTWTKLVIAQKGKSYRASIAWMRQIMTVKTGTNLDLEILNGATVIASSTTKLNFDEVAFFRAPRNGAYIMRVKGVGAIQKDKQEFGWAFTEGSGPPVEGDFGVFGAGCPGAPQKCGICSSINWTQTSAGTTTSASKIAILETTNNDGLNICGVDFFTSARSATTNVTVQIQLFDPQKQTPGKVVATGQMQVGTKPGIYSVKLKTTALPKNDIFFITFDNADKLNLSVSKTGQAGIHYEWKNNAWGSIQSNTRWQYRIMCDKGSQIPTLSSTGKPIIGRSLPVDLKKAKANTAALMFLGFSNSQWGAFKLPLTFAPGCQLLVSGDLAFGTAVNGNGEASLGVAIPNAKDLINLTFFVQYIVRDSANTIGWIATNGGRARIGEF